MLRTTRTPASKTREQVSSLPSGTCALDLTLIMLHGWLRFGSDGCRRLSALQAEVNFFEPFLYPDLKTLGLSGILAHPNVDYLVKPS